MCGNCCLDKEVQEQRLAVPKIRQTSPSGMTGFN
jgi:hypothetical protein